MVIEDTGNVGIGTVSPTSLLNIYKGAPSGGERLFDVSTDDGQIFSVVNYSPSNDSVYLRTEGVMYIGTDGDIDNLQIHDSKVTIAQNVGIGTTNPQRTLHVGPSSNAYIALTNDNTGHTTSDGLFIGLHNDGSPGQIIMYENAPLEFRTNDTVRMTISSSGEVGIGTSAPISPLEVHSAGGADVRIVRSDSTTTDGESLGRILWSSTDGNVDTVDGSAVIEALAAEDYGTGNKGADLRFGLKPIADDFDHTAHEYMRILSNGNVGIGSSSPAYKLHSVGDIKVESGAIGVNVNPSATDGRIDAGNDVVAYSSSDIRFKKNITPIQDALFKVQQIQGIEFDWIPNEEQHGYDGHDVGVIAQEVVEVLPEVVQTRESGYMAVKYEKMIPLLVEGIKEQQKQIDELKDKVRELEDA
jgi:hypothetical protein